jgi:hypothetical protein
MAETAEGNKIVRVKGYTRADGTKVATHDRSTPDTSSGAKRPTTKKERSQVIEVTLGSPRQVRGRAAVGARNRNSPTVD